MSKIAYVNGKYLNFNNALISINDRSVHFSDAVYEVVAVYNSKLVFWKEHYDRLKKSLKLIGVDNFKNLELIYFKCNEIIRVNNLVEGLIYIQISRGIALRNHNWSKSLTPSLIISALHKEVFKQNKPISLISNEDIRWKCSNIKSTALLGNVLLKQKALYKNAFECVMYDERKFITEATTSNLWIIKDKKIYTPPLKKNILAGVTRKKIFDVAKYLKIEAKEKEIRLISLSDADGVFLSNSSSLLVMAKKIDKLKLNMDKDNIYKLLYNSLLKTIRESNEKRSIK